MPGLCVLATATRAGTGLEQQAAKPPGRSLDRVGRLDAISTLLSDARLFLYSYVRKEAVMSSQIEGTQSSLSDLMLYEIKGQPGVPLDDVQEVSCYVKAMSLGVERIRQGKSCHQMLSQFLNLPQSAG